GPVTYPNARRLAEVVRAVGLDALVVETDCPYLPPQPWRGPRNEPADLPRARRPVPAAPARARPAERAGVSPGDRGPRRRALRRARGGGGPPDDRERLPAARRPPPGGRVMGWRELRRVLGGALNVSVARV